MIKMTYNPLLYFAFCEFLCYVISIRSYGPQPRVVSVDGHLTFYAAPHKNISLLTTGRGSVHVNGLDLSQTARITNTAFQAMKRYQTTFESSFEKISRLEQFLDDDFLTQKIRILQGRVGNATNTPLNAPSVIRNIRRLNRTVNGMKKTIKALSELMVQDECRSNPCKNGGTCQDALNGFNCRCPPEWEGPACDRDVNECARFSGTDLGCQNGATCHNRPGYYECVCPKGWFGLHCTKRTTDCTSASNAEMCGHGICVTQYDVVGYKCICDQGWTTDGKTPACNTDVNECTTNKPPCSVNPPVQCINIPGSFQCGECPAGYSGNGFYCSDVDECLTFNGGCSVNPMVQCINTLGSRMCGHCPPGYAGDGVTCSYQGVCSVDNGGCHRLATCRNNPRLSRTLVECVCPVGYMGNGIGPNGCVRSLQPTPGPCFPNPCIHGTCAANDTTGYTCQCYRRYTGRDCGSLRDLCDSNPCQNGGTCSSFLGVSYRCICPESYSGLRCEEERQACGGRLQSETGTLAFPSGVYQTYSNARSCAWTIETNVTEVLNITFSKFNVEGSRSCQYDWLQIHDGKNTLARSLGRFCGGNLPNGGVIISTHNIVYLWFRSDLSVTGEGFQLNWTSIVPFCGEELKENASHGTIFSPGSPGYYPNNRDCYWPLQAPLGKRLLFHFFTLMIGNNSNCDDDYLEFVSGVTATDAVFAKFCNTSHPAPLFSPGPEVTVHFHSDGRVNHPGFQITYSAVEGIPGCGGVFTNHQGEIRSPSYDGNYPNDVQCEYKIQLPEDSRIKLTFLSFVLEESEDCQFDYVAIHAGGTTDAPLIGKYCGSTVPSSYTTEDNVVLVEFKTDWATSEGGFVIKYETVCGGTFTEPSGAIESPGYPNTYASSLRCIYEIVQPLGNVINFHVVDLDLEVNSSPEFLYDFLEVRDGHDANSTLIGTYSDKAPNRIVSTYNYLWIKFVSDSSNNGRGFRATYTITKLGCGGIMKGKTGTFSTPNYPEVYPSGTSCRWIISAPPGNVIQILWLNFQIEKSYECSYDYIEIFDNNTETGTGISVGKYCGQTAPPALLSTTNLVTVVFKTDATYNLGGFLVSYSVIQESNVCGGNYYTSVGVLKSPGYPSNYPVNMECAWTIRVKSGYQIMLNVTDFSLENYSVCRYDWLEIRNGASATSPLLGKYCGRNIPKLIPSHANQLHVHFRSDMTKPDRGFRITWEATATGCGGTLNTPTGSIISPNYPEPYTINAECLWKISIGAGSLIQVVFSDLDLEDHSSCLLDFVELLDGPALNSKSLGKFCSVNPSFVRSTSNTMTVRFRSDMSRNGRGFQLQYTTLCNNTVTGFRGVIESPNFPNNYPSSVNCNWEILVADRNKINISFSHFDLEKVVPNTSNNNTCVYDYVEVLYTKPVEPYEEEGSFEKFGVYCGDETPPLITVNSHHAKIHFVSDNMLHGNGFRLEWQIEGCGDVLTRPEGTIMSPNYPKAYPPSIECNWKIQVDFGSQVEITFYDVQLETTSDCNMDYIKLYNGEDETYPEISTICHQIKPITLRGSGNFMFVKFKADISIQGFGFYANYTTKSTKCGGRYTASRANIMSPNYPNNYDKDDTCGYQIEVNEGHVVALKFEDFDLYAPSDANNCSNNNSHVKVFDGPTRDYRLLATLCGKTTGETINSTTNQLYVEMVTTGNVVAKGFLAKYRQSCGARIETEGTGLIQRQLNYGTPEDDDCSWTIVAKDPSKHVSLTITHLESLNIFCSDSYKSVRIYSGESAEAPLLGEYCGPKIPPMLTTEGSAMYINVDASSVFVATYSVYDSVCGGTLTSTEGYFASPGYPKKYPMEMECEWTIEISEGNHVSLSFIYFELLESEHCNTDFLEVRQGNSTGKLLGVFCGDDPPTNITNLGSLWILLKTSRVDDLSTLTAKGFYAEYIFDHENELTGPSGTIKSPLYNRGQPLYGQFSWKITVKWGKRILLTFKEMSLEGSDSMCFSEITVYDGPYTDSPSLGSFCGNDPPNSLTSRSYELYIVFSGYSATRSWTGFVLEWLEVEATLPKAGTASKATCGSIEPIDLDALNNYTVISSPGYPDGYGNSLNCEWTVTTISMNRLKIYVLSMDLQRSFGPVCYADYVEIFEKSKESDWTSVRKICHENATHGSLIFTTNLMKVVFKTDVWGNGTGFSLTVREDCGGTLTDPSGYIIFDNSTLLRLGITYTKTCQWNITVKAGRTIRIEFLHFDIFYNPSKHCDNFLMVRNGKFPDSPFLGDGKYCGDKTPPTLNTTGNNAFLKLSGVSTLMNLRIRYREVSYSCGGQITLTQLDNVTEITSPNYPNVPPPHIECLWRIAAPPGEILRIDFVDRFDLTYNKGCTEEYVEVRDGGTVRSKLIDRYCRAPNSQFTTDSMMFVKFYTDTPDPSNGFKARISLDNCGGTVRGAVGQIQSPFFNVPSKYPSQANCTWHLMTTAGHSMEIKFTKFDLDCLGGNYVTIYEPTAEGNQTSPLGNFCGNQLPEIVKTSGNEASVSFRSGRIQKPLRGFSLQFNGSVDACGGTIEASEGTIRSPGYPSSSATQLRRCKWLIRVPKGRRVKLEVEDIDLTKSLHNAYLIGLLVYNLDKYQGFVGKLTETNKVFESCDNTMFVSYWASVGAGRGFKAKFSSNEPAACQGDLDQDSGTITQPTVKGSYVCTYTRDRPLEERKTVAMTIVTTTNATLTTQCNIYYGSVKVKTTDDEDINGVQCIPGTATIRAPYPKFKILAQTYHSLYKVNYTISFNTYDCGGILNYEMGTVASPGYPNKFSRSLECSWLVKIPEEQTVLLTFSSLDLGSNCEQSYLDIYNGDSPSSPRIDRFCQNHIPGPINSQTNSLWIDYKFDKESDGKGFSLRYEPKIKGCGGVFHDHSRVIQSPSYPRDYPDHAECLWELRSDEGYHIGLVFSSRFQIEQSDDCVNDFLEVWDWRDDGWVSLGRKCGRELPTPINSTSNRMKILFRSNGKVTGKGFRAQWTRNCGGSFTADNTERFIVSPGFPLNYRNNLDCQYNISANLSQFVNIKFYSFSLEGTGTFCKFDNVTISNVWNTGGIRLYSGYQQAFCGSKNPPDIRLSNMIYMRFRTDPNVVKSGFKFSYQLDNCGGDINAPGVISTPPMNLTRSPGLYHGYMNCKWNITGPLKKIVVIRFQSFQFEYRRGCYYDNVEIYDGPLQVGTNRLVNLCGDLSRNLPVITTKNNTAVISMRSDRTMNHGGFKAEVYFVDGPEVGCGGRIQLNGSMSIISPDLPDLDCSWSIYSAVGTSIKLHFNELNLRSSCNFSQSPCSSLEIKNGHPSVAETIELLSNISGRDFGREITTTGNSAGLRFFTRGLIRNAFRLVLTTVPSKCGPTYLNVTRDIQTLMSPDYPNTYPSNLICNWVLRGFEKFVVHFVDFELEKVDDLDEIQSDCEGDNIKIVDDVDNNIDSGYGPLVVLSGNKRTSASFNQYGLYGGSHQFCGNTEKPFDYYSNENYLTVKFSSGDVGPKRGKGFKIEYHTVGCNRNYTMEQGRISHFLRNQQCYQTITVPENYTISLYFVQFSIHPTVNCEQQGVEIRDGGSPAAPLLLRSCGFVLPNSLFSSRSKLWVFTWSTTQLPVTYDLVYTSTDKGPGCGGNLYNNKGRFTSPLHPLSYKNSTPCVWVVRVPVGMRVAVKFSVFDIQDSCEASHLIVTTYQQADATEHKFCKNDQPAVLYSNSNVLRVSYQSSLTNDGTGWSALFEAVHET